jgi:hypothetical protein
MNAKNARILRKEKKLKSTIKFQLLEKKVSYPGICSLVGCLLEATSSGFCVKHAIESKPIEKIQQGEKHDQNKPDLSMVSWELVEAIAKVREFGAKKYDRDNWKKGFKVTRSLAACLRHVFLFLSGETNDSESGLLHLAHAVACLEHAIYDMKHRPDTNDDRYKP